MTDSDYVARWTTGLDPNAWVFQHLPQAIWVGIIAYAFRQLLARVR